MVGEWIKKTNYPQAPSMTSEEVVSLCEEALFARLGTFNQDGSIHIAPVFFKSLDDQILIATQEPSRKIRNIKRHNNVTILIDISEVPFRGALIYGTAELDYEDVLSKRIAIFERTRSRQEAVEYARKLIDKWNSVIIRVTPVNVASFDYSKF